MTLPDLNNELSLFRLGGVILCLEPLRRNGSRLFCSARPMSPANLVVSRIGPVDKDKI